MDYNYTFAEEVRSFFRLLHVSKDLTEEFLRQGSMDYRTFLEERCGCVMDDAYWRMLRINHGVGNAPLQLGGGNVIIWSRDRETGETLVLMQKRRLEGRQRIHQWGFTGGGYANWRHTVGKRTYHAAESSFLCALREAKEESGRPLVVESMTLFNRENATSYPNGQVVLHVESIFYLLKVPYSVMEGYKDTGSDEGSLHVLRIPEIRELSHKRHVFPGCRETVKKLLKELSD